MDLDSVNILQKTYISRMELFYPSKAQALSYLDGAGAVPNRYAHVWVNRGSDGTPSLAEYKVGPLGSATSNWTVHVIKSDVNFNLRRVDTFEYGELFTLLEVRNRHLHVL